jgi:hypothetical protein
MQLLLHFPFTPVLKPKEDERAARAVFALGSELKGWHKDQRISKRAEVKLL